MTTSIQLPNSSSAAEPIVGKDEAIDPKKTIGFYEVVPRDELICSISLRLMKLPVSLKECGHVFDETSIIECYKNKPEDKKICPTCCAVAPTYTTNRFIKNAIDALKKHPLWDKKAFYENLVETTTPASAPDNEQEIKDKIAAIVSDWRRGGHTSEATIELLYGVAAEFPKSKDACEEAVSKLLNEVKPEVKSKKKISSFLPSFSSAPFTLLPNFKFLPHKFRPHVGNEGEQNKPVHRIYASDEDLSVD